MPRYVILEHDWPHKHWDFMLEAGTILQTWRLPDVPQAGVAMRAEKSFDHRLLYLDYEGPISGGRGSVSHWDDGAFETLIEQENRRVIQLKGKRLRGIVELVHHPEMGWKFIF